jgi:rhamnopyranosyl-N-acetylglucosaminyl-diphospho-decaprenol beta-1,3/1,4-galactofuranosyltransferase
VSTESAMDNPTIVAVVLTYNRRDLLRRCLEAVLTQARAPAKVIVIDNASTDGTSQMLAQDFPSVDVRCLPENSGYSGGMRAGLMCALGCAPHYIWFLDDDAIPLASCLETLVREMQGLATVRRVGVLRPLVQDPETGKVMGGGVSCGTLLKAEMVATVPLPPTELFMEYDDKIYEIWIRRAGYEIVRLPLALVHHPVRRPQTFRQILSEGYRTTPWRLYYRLRNRIYFSLYMERSLPRLFGNLSVGARAIALLTLFGRPRRGQGLVIKGIVDGLLGRLGRRIEPSY